ncbi:hypothetical protein Aduo_005229 [Ancylostoma duodenale]
MKLISLACIGLLVIAAYAEQAQTEEESGIAAFEQSNDEVALALDKAELAGSETQVELPATRVKRGARRAIRRGKALNRRKLRRRRNHARRHAKNIRRAAAKRARHHRRASLVRRRSIARRHRRHRLARRIRARRARLNRASRG